MFCTRGFVPNLLLVATRIPCVRRFVWQLQHANHDGTPAEDSSDAWHYTGGSQVLIPLL